ncbi:hypothetical protein [Mycolicibacterium fortuitum]|uniref:hypothetical protein n=1 Tax=Mycolicibacterium fortuitum TaxID=1766 RepID=UPI00260AC1C9|nr:hypothetical protein [Mycolicibacterium fortuitum]
MTGTEVIVRAVFTSGGDTVGQVIDKYADPFEYLHETQPYPPDTGLAEQAARDWALAHGHRITGSSG